MINNHTAEALVTTVHYNYWLGKLYFIPVKPFHKLIIISSLRKTVKKLDKNIGENK